VSGAQGLLLRIAGWPRARVNRSVPLTVTLSLTRRWIAGEKLSHPPVPILNAFYVRLLEPAKTDRNGRMYVCWRGQSTLGNGLGPTPHRTQQSVRHLVPGGKGCRRRAPRSTGRDLAAAELIGRLIEEAVSGSEDTRTQASYRRVTTVLTRNTW
jgi:hypothetical protein